MSAGPFERGTFAVGLGDIARDNLCLFWDEGCVGEDTKAADATKQKKKIVRAGTDAEENTGLDLAAFACNRAL